MNWTDIFLRISPDNQALRFLARRINNPSYRGSRSSQHNRYELDHVYEILTLLNKVAPNKELLSIRTTDISKRMKVMPDERKYTMFCEQCKEKTGIGSVDAMRKNLFPDFHRMGLINRYNKDEDVLDPYDQNSTKKYVALTDMGLKFIESDNPLDRHYIFSKGINGLLEGRIDILLNIFNTPEYEIGSISSYEYMFFVSAIGTDEEFALTIQKAVDMVRTYRSLTHTQRRSVINALKDILKPMRSIPKPQKRDFHNWHNKIQQIYHLLKQTIYFDVDDGCLVPIYDEDSESRLNRSISQKSQYFERHRVQKQYGFELHHVVPLSYSECKNHFKLLDVWENMVYIDGFTHAKITQKRSKNIIMKSVGNDLELLDYQGNKITLTYDTRVKYHTQNQPVMIKRNEELRMI